MSRAAAAPLLLQVTRVGVDGAQTGAPWGCTGAQPSCDIEHRVNKGTSCLASMNIMCSHDGMRPDHSQKGFLIGVALGRSVLDLRLPVRCVCWNAPDLLELFPLPGHVSD